MYIFAFQMKQFDVTPRPSKVGGPTHCVVRRRGDYLARGYKLTVTSRLVKNDK